MTYLPDLTSWMTKLPYGFSGRELHMGTPLGFGRVPIKKSSLEYVCPVPVPVYQRFDGERLGIIRAARTPASDVGAPCYGIVWICVGVRRDDNTFPMSSRVSYIVEMQVRTITRRTTHLRWKGPPSRTLCSPIRSPPTQRHRVPIKHQCLPGNH